MGGILILASIFVTTVIWGNLSNHYVSILLLTVLLFGFIGFIDDYLMQVKKRNMGFTARGKFTVQVIFGLVIGFLIYKCPDFTTTLTLPFLKDFSPDLGIYYIPFACLVIVGTSNAVNLTDGLDGLAIGPYIVASVTYMFFAYVAGHTQFAEYLHVRHISSAGEITVICVILAGAGLGFLWFNAHPAQVFMGDTGSMAIGGTDAAIAKLKGGKVEDPVQAAFVQFFKEKAAAAKASKDDSEEKAQRAAMIAKMNSLAKNEGFFFAFDASGTPKMTA